MLRYFLALLSCLLIARLLPSAEPIENTPDEAKAEEFSLARAVAFLDDASVHWTKSRQCFTCHTNYVHLIVAPTLPVEVATPAHQEIRRELEKLVDERWATTGPRWDAEVVMSAAVLAMHDRATTGKLHPTTRKALARMWTVQLEDGGFSWLKCGWPPMESDDDYGVAIAALAAAAAPEDYLQSPEAQAGVSKLKSYLSKTPPPTLHHSAMLLWPERYGLKLLSVDERQQTIERLWSLQKPDGGWNSATLGNWDRGDGGQQDVETSDGYATGLVLFVLQVSGVGPGDERIAKGLGWLETNQRASGRWHTRSLNRDSKHYLSHAGTAMAIMALTYR